MPVSLLGYTYMGGSVFSAVLGLFRKQDSELKEEKEDHVSSHQNYACDSGKLQTDQPSC